MADYERNVVFKSWGDRFYFAPKVRVVSETTRAVVGKKYDITEHLQPYLLKKYRKKQEEPVARVNSIRLRKRFPIGCKVVLSREGRRNFSHRCYRGGTVVGYGRQENRIRVKRPGIREVSTWAAIFWKPESKTRNNQEEPRG